jgi:hypothetical protein
MVGDGIYRLVGSTEPTANQKDRLRSGMVNNLPQSQDVISIASQLGRFDLASLLLTAIAVLIAILALPVFGYLKYSAGKAARDEVRKITEGLHEAVEREAISKMEAMLPTLVEQYKQLGQNSVTDEIADDIAEAQDEPTHGDNNLSGNQGGATDGA